MKRSQLGASRWAAAMLLLHTGSGCAGIAPIHTASARGETAALARILDEGEDVDRPTGEGWTPLMFAAQAGSEPSARVLIDRGAVPSRVNKGGYTAFLIACHHGQLPVVKLLLDRGVELEERNLNNETALMVAAARGKSDVARELVARGADVNARSSPVVRGPYNVVIERHEGNTPLYYACYSGNQELAMLLLEHGADPTPQGQGNLSPMQLAPSKAVLERMLSVAQRAAGDLRREMTKERLEKEHALGRARVAKVASDVLSVVTISPGASAHNTAHVAHLESIVQRMHLAENFCRELCGEPLLPPWPPDPEPKLDTASE